jgi:hypothetical protein
MTRIIITILVYCLAGWLVCDIDPTREYYWYSGIWHGMFFVVNWVRSCFFDCLYKAEIFSTAYNVFYWIFAILSFPMTFGTFFGYRPDRY